ncbi:hypothetical protein NC796_14710 [Aliifodinibius sp. S!AR15-10]|uniref:hypothetical protein n=1 Tax=Aliifodinibius sp. S!AR15-10 TaxID=2950437 RepID=UPI0028644037|nr:hypothetical protein [Aliifodinibius sp. S!AR15-10]MDR8392402.1 hypothetical protein [Aliifodinibius sp. S!AR15-10]
MMSRSINKVISYLLAVVFILLITSPSQTHAQTLKGRAVIHIVPDNTRMVKVPGVSGQNLILAHFKGLVFLNNGEIAEVMGAETIHRPKGSGRYLGYEVLTFSDGSTIMSKVEGSNKPSEDGKSVQFEGTFTYIQGTGRFAGIEGSGELEGRSYIASGSGGYYDFEGTYSVPSN